MSTAAAAAHAATDRPPVAGSLRARVGTWLGRLAIVCTVVAASLALTPRSNTDAVQVVDWASAAARAQAAAPFTVLVPADLPPDWRAISARTDVRRGTVHWHLEFDTPDGRRVGVEQSDRPAYTFIAEMTERGAAAGLSTVNKSLWVRTYAAGRDHRAIWLRDADVATVVGGTGSWAQVEEFADALVPQGG